MRQHRCRNCGRLFDLPDYYAATLIVCQICEWQEVLPARRKLPEKLDRQAGAAFQALHEHEVSAEEALGKLRGLSQDRFEQFCASLFDLLGYAVTVSGHAYEEGHNLELRKGDELTLAECKCYAEYHKVELEEVENLAGDMRHHRAAHGVFVTTSTFAEACAECAKKTGIDLLDGEDLRRSLESVPTGTLDSWWR